MDARTEFADDEAERLRQLVLARFGCRVRDFRVLVRGGGLVLQGKVETYFLKQMVQEAVFRATASRIVTNEVVVE